MKKHFNIALGLLLASFGNAFALTATSTFPVSATVPSSCAINSSSGISFSPYLSTLNRNGTGTISMVCTNTTSWTLSANSGSGTFTNRLMNSGVNTLNYNIYTTSSYTSIFGDGTSATVVITGTGTGLTQTTTVYGRIPAAQNAAPGSYTDSLVITLSY